MVYVSDQDAPPRRVTMARLETGSLSTALVPSPVDYRVLLPDNSVPTGQRLPLLLCLHGGVGGHDLLDQLTPIFRDMWATAALPEMIVVAPEAGHSFYLDYRNGSQSWESFLTAELLPHIRQLYPVFGQSDRTLVCGISMGGMGALRLGLKYPEIFGAIVAWEPAIEPALAWTDVKLADRFWRSEECMETRFGRPLDEAYWAANNPATIVATQASAVRESAVRLYLEIGTDDVYGLDRGAELLHRTLYDNGIKHEYRCVYGADHIGSTIAPRFRDGLGFLARILKPDKPDPHVEQLRKLVAMQKRRAGIED
jgi:S-formylglutathione hydrolase